MAEKRSDGKSMRKNIAIVLVFIMIASCVTLCFSVIHASHPDVVLLSFDYRSTNWGSYGGNLNVNDPPVVSFSMANGAVLYELGNFNVALTAAIGSPVSLQNFGIALYSVSYKASWEGNKATQVYQWSINDPANISDDDPNPQGGFFYVIDLTNVPQGIQQIEVTAVGGGYIFGNGYYTFSSNTSSSLSFTISAPPSHSPTQTSSLWNLQVVGADGAGGVGDLANCPIAVDSNEIPHIAYTSGGHLVQYAVWNGIGWSTQTIDRGYLYGLALDNNNTPHLVYGGSRGLTYATLIGSNLTLQTVDPNGAGFAALAFGSAGSPHIAYGNGTAVKYASWAGSSWQIQSVDTVDAPAVSSQFYLAFNQSNIPYILYSFASSSDDSKVVKLAIGNNTGWSIQTIFLPSPVSGLGNMVLDSKGYPHFISAQSNILNFTESTLFYLSWNGTGWGTREIVSNITLLVDSPSTNWMYMGSVALDSNNNPHVTYTTTAGKVVYASWTGTSWNITSVEGYTSATKPGFLALDSSGNPHISFYGPIVMTYGYHNLLRIYNITHATALMPVVAEPTPTPEPESSPVVPVAVASVVVVVVFMAGLLVYFKKRGRG